MPSVVHSTGSTLSEEPSLRLTQFAKGTKEAAFESGAAPITLIDGDSSSLIS